MNLNCHRRLEVSSHASSDALVPKFHSFLSIYPSTKMKI